MNQYKKIVDNALLIQIGSGALYIIKKRTMRGKFLAGSTGTDQYSTNPLPLPAASLTKKGVQNFNKLVADGDASFFRSKKSGKLWILLKDGYKGLRELVGKETDKVRLSWSGKMMRNFKILRTTVARGSVQLGWTDSKLAQIASYHNDLGAGKSKITHKFVGLSKGEVRQMANKLKRSIHLKTK